MHVTLHPPVMESQHNVGERIAFGQIHPNDMRVYLERFGLDLIVEKVEDEQNCPGA